MTPPTRGRALPAILLACAAMAAPATAQAESFFVDQSGSGTECTEAAPCATISEALAASRATPGTGDRIEVAPGLYEERVVIDKAEDSGLTLHGAGRGPDQETTPPDATTLRAPETNKGAEVEITTPSAVSIEALRVEVPAGFSNGGGISIGGAAESVDDVDVRSAGGINTEGIEVTPTAADAFVRDARVRSAESRALAIFGPRATVTDSDIWSAVAQALDVEIAGEGTRVVRTRLATEGSHLVTVLSPEVLIDTSLLTGGQIGAEVHASYGASNSLTLSNDTIDAGEPKVVDKFAAAVTAEAEGASTARLRLVNTIALEKQEVEGGGTQSVVCSSSIVPVREVDGPEGVIECGAGAGNLFAPPSSVFAPGAADWHLSTGSPAVDSGTEGEALSTVDLDGNPRVLDGDGDGVAVIDRGAYELPTPPPPTSGPPAIGPANSFSFGKLRRNKRRGTAKLDVEIPGPGSLALSGRKVKRAAVEAGRAGAFSLSIVPKRNLARALRSKRSAKTSIEVAFTPTGGSAATRARRIRLIRKAGRPGRGEP
ncbi:MAG TPA: choice-of-anchor Q domain-containing protein [Solirubrobacterales bacterium]